MENNKDDNSEAYEQFRNEILQWRMEHLLSLCFRLCYSKFLHLSEFSMCFAHDNDTDSARAIGLLAYKHGAKIHIFSLASPKVTQKYNVTR